MNNKLCCNQALFQQATKTKYPWAVYFAAACFLFLVRAAQAADAPQWMHALVNAPLPAHDEKTDAVLMYSEMNVTVQSEDKIKTQVRKAYKILRPGGRDYGIAEVFYTSPGQKVTSLHGWSIPASGKDYEAKDKEAIDVAIPGVPGSELIDDSHTKLLRIPASDPGNIVGYEYEVEEHPLVLQDRWLFQFSLPVRESHYSLQLPPGWEYRASFLNYPEVKPTGGTANQWQWVVNDVKGIRHEEEMPPFGGVAGQMILSFFPSGGPSMKNGFSNWREMGTWYWNLQNGRTDASAGIKQKVAELTGPLPTQLAKMKALGHFVQHDIRYVAIELGIGGWQPHPAQDIFTHRYGDCKDKANLMRSMLREIGIESYQIAINTERGSITTDTPAYQGFNHQITVIKLPEGLTDPSLVAVVTHPRLGRILFFDPTDELTPFGQISGSLQANWGLMVTADGGELIELPKQPSDMNSIQRTGKLTLDPSGTLKGDIHEVRQGDRAWVQRGRLLTVAQASDQIKPIESLLSDSLTTFHISKAIVVNLHNTDQPFGFDYSFEAENYAKNAGGLLLLRPRVLGSKGSGIMETKEPRKFPVEFDGPVRDTDTFEIALPPGYEVDDLPPAVDVDYGYANYHSKTELAGNVIRYSRAFEVKELSVPVSKADELKKFYRIIAGDERNTAVLKPVGK
jgi:hypothetical protein